jgi:predicted acetyltransferase
VDVTTLEIVEAGAGDHIVLERLLELYRYDFSVYDGADVDAHGHYGYPFLDRYWADPHRHVFLARVDGRLAGFALVRTGDPHDMAEFFVMRKYRRSGTGTTFARDVFARFPGAWQVRQLRTNEPAQAFWRRTIPASFVEDEWEHGPMQRFTME